MLFNGGFNDTKKHPIWIATWFLVLTQCLVFNRIAQGDTEALEKRVAALEDYVSQIQPSMDEFSAALNDSIQEYTKGLETGLENYSLKLQQNLDERLAVSNRHVVVLNPYSKEYHSIETNTGTFLISIDKTETIAGGLRLTLNIGNPNFADYQNFRLAFLWGSKWPGETVMPYAQWRESLIGAEYSFNGRIEKGKWNSVAVDLSPVPSEPLVYLECEMYVESVELEFE